MDVNKLRQCEDEDDFSDLFDEDVLGGYNSPSHHPNHKQIAVVDHLSNYNINQLKSFFEKVQKELKVRFWIGDATSINIDGKRFDRYFLYSDEEPLICMNFNDGLYLLQEPLIERLDGITIDLKGLSITFKNDGEVLSFDSIMDLKKALNKILKEYWPELDSPDIKIRNSLSENPATKWMVESLSCQLMAFDSQEEKILLAKRFEKFIPKLKFEFTPEDYIPLVASLQLASAMNDLDFATQNKIISSLVLCFGFFDDFM